ncbi:hypothetical protein KCU81_g8258, partial [Aureobasidium melanogenum]|uniref:DUF7707 domain-containing protein n=1 Tax=Aureobasidium melanogenum (strain CBS 110374) TaxID=1043003 RepID=A0A074W051_AURM1
MLYSTIFFAASAFTGLAAAQVQSGNYTIDPNSVDSTTRSSWCRAEFNTCNVLCGSGGFKTNSCDANSLTYSCVCNNGLTPNMSQYESSLPDYECQTYRGQCLANNAGNSTAQDQCKQITCASMTASNLVTSSTMASSSSSAASSASSTAASATSAVASGSQTAASSAASATHTGAANALTIGNGALIGSLFGVFAYAL